MDAIDRQAAIRWVKTECNPYGKPTLEFESGKKVIEHLEQMPPVQPEKRTQERTETHACDSISRQAAIEAATYGNPQTAWQRIEALPSVQPENTILKAINNIRALTGCEELIITDKNSMRTWDANGVEYKIYPERKKGKWINDRLVSTNGGTYGVRRCSECEAYYQDVGYGWNYCPNCGSYNGGENEV